MHMVMQTLFCSLQLRATVRLGATAAPIASVAAKAFPIRWNQKRCGAFCFVAFSSGKPVPHFSGRCSDAVAVRNFIGCAGLV
jgi:hypothetical protein